MASQTNPWSVVITVVITAVIIGGGVYYWQAQNSTEIAGSLPYNGGPGSSDPYENATYRFSLTFPQTWKGYTAKNRTLNWGSYTSDSIDFGFSSQDSLFNISIHPKSQWQQIKSEEGPTPTYLGENSQYVFGYSTAQDAANNTMIARMTEVQEIVKTFKLLAEAPTPTATTLPNAVDFSEGDVTVRFDWDGVTIDPEFDLLIGSTLSKSLSPNKKYLYVTTAQGGGQASFIYDVSANTAHFLGNDIRGTGKWLPDGRLEVINKQEFGEEIGKITSVYRSESSDNPWKMQKE